MNLIKLIIVFITVGTLMTSCVTKKKYNALDANLKQLETEKTENETKIAKNQLALKKLTDQVKDLQSTTDYDKQRIDSFTAAMANNPGGCAQMLGTLKDLSIITPDQSAGLEQSLKNLSSSNKDALSANLMSNVKSAIGAGDTDIIVTTNRGFIYITLSDHMFFTSGSADLTAKGKAMVEKVAKLLNAHADVQFMVQGHTDNQAMHASCVPDNWDLSAKRATTVVKVLQKQYAVNPTRMLAAGHGEYEPVAANDTPANRAKNRRITIVLMPQLDQFFKMLEKK